MQRIGFAALLVCVFPCLAGSGPQPPCGASPSPPFPGVDSPPAIQVWSRTEWTPSACTGWVSDGAATLIAAAARFRFDSGAEALRRRIGAVSSLAGLVYWSTSSQRWQPFILSAAALTGLSGDRRGDFSVAEIAAGRELYVQQEDNLFGLAVYRLRVTAASAARIVFASENATAVKILGLTAVSPGDLQTVCFLERESPDVWRYYSLARIGGTASLLTTGHDASLINRAAASFRFLAGIPLDREPPAAR